MMSAKNLHIIGIVQGVFYRKSTWGKAQELGVKGWVRNCNDGSVEVHVEGDPISVEKLIAWCWQGPPRAEVQDIDIEDVDEEGFDTFEIRGDNWQ